MAIDLNFGLWFTMYEKNVYIFLTSLFRLHEINKKKKEEMYELRWSVQVFL